MNTIRKFKTGIDWNQVEIITPEMAYLLGLLWADGYIIRRKTGGWITLNNLYSDGLYFKKIFEKTGNWSIKDVSPDNRQKQMKFTCYENEFVDWLITMDYSAKSYKGAEKVLNYVPEKYHHLWFLGLFDGDGGLYFNPSGKHFKLTVASSYEQDWAYLENILNKLNILFKVKRVITNNSKYSKIEITSKYSIIDFGKYIYQSQFGLPRKKEKMDFLIEKTYQYNLNLGIVYRKKKNLYEIYGKNKKYLGSAKSREEAINLKSKLLNQSPTNS